MELNEEVRGYLQAHNTVTLATVGPDGPWAAGLFYASDEFSLYFLSDPSTRHGQNLAFNPNVAATVHEDYRDWRLIKGIQLEGTCAPLESREERTRAADIYVAKFPFVRDFVKPKDGKVDLTDGILTTVWYRIVPARMLFIDNEKGFGDRREVKLR